MHYYINIDIIYFTSQAGGHHEHTATNSVSSTTRLWATQQLACAEDDAAAVHLYAEPACIDETSMHAAQHWDDSAPPELTGSCM